MCTSQPSCRAGDLRSEVASPGLSPGGGGLPQTSRLAGAVDSEPSEHDDRGHARGLESPRHKEQDYRLAPARSKRVLRAPPGARSSSARGCSSSARWIASPRPGPRAGYGRRSRRRGPLRPAPHPYGGEQVALGDGHRDLVVPRLHPEVACETATSADPASPGAGLRQQGRVGRPSRARRGDGSAAGRPPRHRRGREASRPRSATRCSEVLRQRGAPPRPPRATRGSSTSLPASSRGAQPGSRLEPDARGAARRRTGAAPRPSGRTILGPADKLPGGDPGQAAARRLAGSPPARARHRPEQLIGGPAGVGGEPVGEGVGPDPPRPRWRPAGAALAQDRAGLLGDPRQRCAAGRPRRRTLATRAEGSGLRSIALATFGGVSPRPSAAAGPRRSANGVGSCGGSRWRQRLGLVGRHVHPGRTIAAQPLQARHSSSASADLRLVTNPRHARRTRCPAAPRAPATRRVLLRPGWPGTKGTSRRPRRCCRRDTCPLLCSGARRP